MCVILFPFSSFSFNNFCCLCFFFFFFFIRHCCCPLWCFWRAILLYAYEVWRVLYTIYIHMYACLAHPWALLFVWISFGIWLSCVYCSVVSVVECARTPTKKKLRHSLRPGSCSCSFHFIRIYLFSFVWSALELNMLNVYIYMVYEFGAAHQTFIKWNKNLYKYK